MPSPRRAQHFGWTCPVKAFEAPHGQASLASSVVAIPGEDARIVPHSFNGPPTVRYCNAVASSVNTSSGRRRRHWLRFTPVLLNMTLADQCRDLLLSAV